MIAMIRLRMRRACQETRDGASFFGKPQRAQYVGRRASGSNTEKDIVRAQGQSLEFRSNTRFLVLATFARTTQRRVAASDDADDLRRITPKCRWTFTRVQHSESTARTGTCRDKPATQCDRVRNCICEGGNRRGRLLHSIDGAVLVLYK